VARRSWFHRLIRLFRTRTNSSDHVVQSGPGFRYYSPRVLISGHHDAKLSPRGVLAWRLAYAVVIVGGIVAIALSR
jgi:hypothetical protein